MELLFIGLDGATWTVLDPLMEAGKLPTLAALRDRSRHGELRTSRPAYTFPAWKVISSGRPPEELGVFGWIGVDFIRHRFTYPDARSFNTPEIWDYLADEGKRVAQVGMPATWPVRPIGPKGDGVMVGGPFSRNDDTIAPPGAAERYGLTRPTQDTLQDFRKGPDEALALLKRLETERFDSSLKLARSGDFDALFHTVFYCDPVQHYHWDDEATMEAAWSWIDARLGELVEACQPERTVVVSDHGFIRVQRQFNVNTWLQQQGLLELEGTEATPWLHRLGITRERVLKVAGVFGLTGEDLAKVVPLKLRRGIPNAEGELEVNRLALVDWHRTRALSADGFQVFVKDAGAREQVVEGLKAATTPGTGRPVFESVVDYAALAGRPNAPVVLTPNDGIMLAHKFERALWKRERDGFSSDWVATHALDGVLMVSGPGVEPGQAPRAHLVDVAPTVLSLLGCRVASSMAGDVLVGKRVDEPREPLPAPFDRTETVHGRDAPDV